MPLLVTLSCSISIRERCAVLIVYLASSYDENRATRVSYLVGSPLLLFFPPTNCNIIVSSRWSKQFFLFFVCVTICGKILIKNWGIGHDRWNKFFILIERCWISIKKLRNITLYKRSRASFDRRARKLLFSYHFWETNNTVAKYHRLIILKEVDYYCLGRFLLLET